MQIKARDLTEGMMFDVPADVVAGTDNEQIQPYEYAVLESVNGGWADAYATGSQVVLYIPNYALPVVIDGDRLVEVIETQTQPGTTDQAPKDRSE